MLFVLTETLETSSEMKSFTNIYQLFDKQVRALVFKKHFEFRRSYQTRQFLKRANIETKTLKFKMAKNQYTTFAHAANVGNIINAKVARPCDRPKFIRSIKFDFLKYS